MLRRHKHFFIALAVLALGLAYLLWSAKQYQGIVPLGRDYRYWYTEWGVYITCFPTERERLQKLYERAEREGWDCDGLPKTGPNVDGYRVFPRVIVGHVSKARETNSAGDPLQIPPTDRPAGYFIIDKRIDRIYDGLSKKEWLDRLRDFGITSEPKLFKPSIYDEILGRNKPDKD